MSDFYNDVITKDFSYNVSHLECAYTGEKYEAGKVHGLSSAGKPILVRYDLEKLKSSITKEQLQKRSEGGFWRYREFLPVKHGKNIASLGEVTTPLIECPKASKGKGKLIVKDEGRLPTGSFKARGLAMAVAMAKELGLNHLAMPTNGNAGAAMAAYATRADLKTTIFCPDDTPEINVSEIEYQGADVYKVNGLINDCGKIVGEGKESVGWFDVSTLKEPYRIEGKKTMGLEIAEQFNWELPDVIFYPTGGGTGLIGMWKAFDELEKIGWIGSKRPRMVVVQAETCAPIVKAWEAGEEHAPVWENASTHAAGIRVPVAVGDFLMIRALNESNGFGITVNEDEIRSANKEMAQIEGLLMSPEGAATYAAYQKSIEQGLITGDETSILFNCATGLKYAMDKVTKTIDKNKPIDYSQF